MDTNELKKLLKGSTAILVLDNGEPSYFIVGYDSYKKVLYNNEQEEKEVKINRSFVEFPDAKVEASLRPVSFETVAQRPATEINEGVQPQGLVSIETDLNKRQYHQRYEPSHQGESYGAGGDGQFQHNNRVGEKESEFLEKINKQILSLKDEIDKEEKSAIID